MNLTDREWREFFIGGKEGIFDLRASNSGIDKNKLVPCDISIIPYISRSELYNGISLFVGEIQNPKYAINKGNVITIGLDTQTVFYQPSKFYTGQNIQVISNCYLNKYNALFITRLLKIQLSKFNWGGNGATLGRLSKTKILLPVDKKNNPDYQFMEDYIKENIVKKCQEYIEYAKNKLKQIKFENISSLKDKKWKEFFIEDIFFIKSGKRLVKEQMIFGDIPFIGASTLNNGITNYISQKNYSFDSNVLGVNYNGSVGEAFYHPYGCIFSDDVKRFHMLNYNDNKFLLLFLATIIKQQKEKFNYGYKFNETRMLRQKILLPVNTNDEPDYIYMEKYIKNIFYKKYSDYLEYVKKAV